MDDGDEKSSERVFLGRVLRSGRKKHPLAVCPEACCVNDPEKRNIKRNAQTLRVHRFRQRAREARARNLNAAASPPMIDADDLSDGNFELGSAALDRGGLIADSEALALASFLHQQPFPELNPALIENGEMKDE